MKRLTIRLTAFSVVAVLGLIAIAQARYGKSGTSEPPPETAPSAADLATDAPQPISTDAEPFQARADLPNLSAGSDLPYRKDNSPNGVQADNLAVEGGSTPEAFKQTPHPRHLETMEGDPPEQDYPIDRNFDEISDAQDGIPDAHQVLPEAQHDLDAPQQVLPETAHVLPRRHEMTPGSDGVRPAGGSQAADVRPQGQSTDGRYGAPRTLKNTSSREPMPGGSPIPRFSNDRHSGGDVADDAFADDAIADNEDPARGQFVPNPADDRTGARYGEAESTVLKGHDRAPHREDANPIDSPFSSKPGIGKLEPASLEGTGLPGAAQLEGAQSPSITVQKFAPDEIQVGMPCTFEIRIRNNGSVAAHDVTVLDEVPQGTRLEETRPHARSDQDGKIVWDLKSLNAGEETTVEMRLMPLSEGEIGSVATVQFQAQASVRTLATKPELELRVTPPGQMMVGENVTINIEISNVGSGAASGLILLEDVPEGMSHPAGPQLEFEVGTLAAGESRDLPLVLTAEKEGKITNTLTARGDANLLAKKSIEWEVIAPQLKVSIKGPKRRYLERKASYTVSVHNPGSAPAKEIELTAYLPKGLKFVRANHHGRYDESAHRVIWGLEELPAQERGDVKLIAIPIEAGDHVLRAKGRAAQGLVDEAEQKVSVEGVAAIMFNVVDLEDPIEVGGETTYEIRVVNQGSKAATNVQVIGALPPDLKPISATGIPKHTIKADAVIFEPLPRLAPKADTTFRIKVQGLASGDQRIKVHVVTDQMKNPVTKEESTTVYADE